MLLNSSKLKLKSPASTDGTLKDPNLLYKLPRDDSATGEFGGLYTTASNISPSSLHNRMTRGSSSPSSQKETSSSINSEKITSYVSA